ncbi:hypothetical protein GF314_06010 [bacterium]|nr:hypothetical protein [bacterium]
MALAHPRHTAGLALALGLLILMTTGCASPPRLVHAWQDPGYAGPRLERILVVGISERASTRRVFESVFSAEFRDRGVAATPSYELFPGPERPDREEFLATVRARGFDGVILSRVVGVDREASVTPGYVVVEPAFAYRRDFWGFYSDSYAVYSSPGYVERYDVVTVETNLYEVAGPSLVWTGQTESVAPTGVEAESAGLARVMMQELVRRGLIAAD